MVNTPFTSIHTPRPDPENNRARSFPERRSSIEDRDFVRVLRLLLCATATFFFCSAAVAQDGADPFAGIEEMVVVGTAASSLFQNQEVSAIAFDEDYLDAIGANDISDVATFTPNLEIRTPFAASNPTLFIRGVGIRDFNANSSSSVAVYNDEIFMNSPAAQLAQLFDVENIDVLRGPQTTQYGRNASAGTIRTIARKPTGTPGREGLGDLRPLQRAQLRSRRGERDRPRHDLDADGGPVEPAGRNDEESLRRSGLCVPDHRSDPEPAARSEPAEPRADPGDPPRML